MEVNLGMKLAIKVWVNACQYFNLQCLDNVDQKWLTYKNLEVEI